MISRSEEIQGTGVLGLLEGISSLLLDQSNYNDDNNDNIYNAHSVLLINANQNIGSDDEWGTTMKVLLLLLLIIIILIVIIIIIIIIIIVRYQHNPLIILLLILLMIILNLKKMKRV